MSPTATTGTAAVTVTMKSDTTDTSADYMITTSIKTTMDSTY